MVSSFQIPSSKNNDIPSRYIQIHAITILVRTGNDPNTMPSPFNNIVQIFTKEVRSLRTTTRLSFAWPHNGIIISLPMDTLMAKEGDQPLELVFLASPQIRQVLNSLKIQEEDPVNLRDLIEWLRNYDLDSLELSVSSVIRKDEKTKFFISSDGEAGCKVVLKLNQQGKKSSLSTSITEEPSPQQLSNHTGERSSSSDTVKKHERPTDNTSPKVTNNQPDIVRSQTKEGFRTFDEWWKSIPEALRKKARGDDEPNKPLLNQVNYVLLHLHLANKHDIKPSHEELKYWLQTGQVDVLRKQGKK
jgi:hypothetical protein